MARINTNISSVIAQAHLNRTQQELNVRLERLSTGLRINRGKDDPAGLIVSERIRSDIQGVDQGVKNAQRASNVIATTEGALAEVNDLLNSIRSLIVQSANTGASSAEERDANQLQIDSAIDSITRISNTASFGGLKLLDGSLDYTLSGVRSSAITTARIESASFINASNIQVDVNVVASAQVGALYYNGGTTPPGVTLSTLTLEIAGATGVGVVTVPSGQPLTSLVNAINNLTGQTGVEAALINNNVNSGVVIRSLDYGLDAFARVKRLEAPATGGAFDLFKFPENAQLPSNTPFDWSTLIGNSTQDKGRDVSALVNGVLASGNGLRLSMNSPGLAGNLLLSEDLATRPGTTTTFHITGGGALFQLGPDVTALQQTNLGVGSIAASSLGGTKTGTGVEFLTSLKRGGTNSVVNSTRRGDFSTASSILGVAIDEITILRGRLGAFERNVLDTNVRSLQSQFENLTASESQIRDADFALETSKLTRAQILASAGSSTLQLANQQSQQVLQLLGR
jgi:flagellin